MSNQFYNQLTGRFLPYLAEDEKVVTAALFKKIPPVPNLILTRGFVRFFSHEFQVAVTNQRLLIIPIQKIGDEKVFQEAISVAFEAVKIGKDLFNDPILEVHSERLERPLKLRFKPVAKALGLSKYEFVAAITQKKALRRQPVSL